MTDQNNPQPLKRFVVFAGEAYYPSGGFEDFEASFEDRDQAITCAKGRLSDDGWHWAHVLDLQAGTLVYHSRDG